MNKKILSLFVAVLTALCAMSQNAVGDWRFHSSFVGDSVKAVAESNRWVYYLSSGKVFHQRIIENKDTTYISTPFGNLFRLDKETQENEALSIINDLSDMTISQVYYNSEKDYLVVIYSNVNIDIILSDGTVVNMPELKNADMRQSKTINDVTFAPGLIYLATDFGYVVIDDNKFVVKESHIYGTPITSAAQIGDQLLLSTADTLYYGNVDKYYEVLKSFKKASYKEKNFRIRPISDSTFFCLTGWTFVTNMKPTGDDGEMKFHGSAIIQNRTTQLQATRDGYLLNVPNLKQCFKTDKDGKNPEPTDTEGELCSSNPNGDGKLWAAGPNGVHQLGSDNYFRPNELSYPVPYWMTYNKEKDLLYVSSPSATVHVAVSAPTYINTYDGMVWSDVTPEGAPSSGSYWLEFMPGDPDTYFLGTWKQGLLKVTNNEIVLKYNNTNSPLRTTRGAMHPVISIDRNGNLWAVQSLDTVSAYPVMVLPTAKTRLDQTTVEDWTVPAIEGLNLGYSQRASFISTKQGSNDIKVFTNGDFGMPITMWKTENVTSVNPRKESFISLTDQDGEQITWTYILCLKEDQNGYVWMGSTEGLCYFNPAMAFEDRNLVAIRPKVPRNDGTGYADRLMDGVQVNDVAVDGAGRKWIATQSSGLFLVSSDGTEIIRKFNSANSPLASNTVYHVCCNPHNNSVYVTTPAGLYEYFSDSSPAESSYNNLFAYPNPVRPEYGGDVTITGMMEGSLIKIADISGNVIRQLKSTGGMATWDLCDESGNRVGTGVYLVLCSQSNGSGNAAVTKIAVVR